MARLKRQIGNLASLFLNDFMQSQRQREQSELTRQRQIELAQQQNAFRAAQAEDAQRQALLNTALQDPDKAARMGRSGIDVGVPLNGLMRTPEEVFAEIISGWGKAKTLADLESQETGHTRYHGNPAIGLHVEGGEEPDFAGAYKRESDRVAAANPTAVEDIDPTGTGRKRFLDPRTLSGQEFQTERTGAQEGERLGASEFGKIKFPGLTEAKIEEGNQLEAGTRGEKVKTAGAESSARAYAQLRAEYDPKIVAAKLDFETKKAALMQDRVGANVLARTAANVKGMQPIYAAYRKTVMDSLEKGLLQENAETVKKAQDTMSKLPIIGSFAGSLMETTRSVVQETKNPGAAKTLSDLDQLADVLALAMANTVFGNRGAVTEADKASAKAALVTSLTSAGAALDRVTLLDRLILKLPEVAARDPEAPRASVIQQALTEVTGKTTNQAPGAARRVKIGPDGKIIR